MQSGVPNPLYRCLFSGLAKRLLLFPPIINARPQRARFFGCFLPLLLKVSGKRLWGFFQRKFGTADAWGGEVRMRCFGLSGVCAERYDAQKTRTLTHRVLFCLFAVYLEHASDVLWRQVGGYADGTGRPYFVGRG